MEKPDIEMENIEKPEKLRPLELKRVRHGRGKEKGCIYYFFSEDAATKVTAEDEEEAVEKLREEMGGIGKLKSVLMTRSRYLKKLGRIT